MLTDMKQTGVPNRTPFSAAQGGTQGNRPRVQMTKPVQTGNAGLTRPVMSNQDAAASRVGAVPSSPSQNPLIQNLPLSAAKPFDEASQMTGSGASQPFQLPISPSAGIPMGEKDWYKERVSSAKGGPTPIQSLYPLPSYSNPDGWWEKYDQQQPQSQSAPSPEGTMLGPWATENAPLQAQGTAPNQNYDPGTVVRNALTKMKNSEIAQLLMEISNGKIRGLSE